MKGYLRTRVKEECFGCEACIQVCQKDAIHMVEDDEGFRYPLIDIDRCVGCGSCNNVCPYENLPGKNPGEPYVFGGYIKDLKVRDRSTSGGFFSALVDAWCDDNYVVFGAEARGLAIYHSYIEDKNQIDRFRKSKYSQSNMGDAYLKAKLFLKEGKKVLFSGTPCQIAALKNHLGDLKESPNLLTIEVVCEGFPSPLFLRKYECYLNQREGIKFDAIDYRFKDGARWDYEVMAISYSSGRKIDRIIKRDRWFNPFWFFWANRLMSRPSCVSCPFRTTDREADITLGDLWGVHLYCPDLYGHNRGCSLAVCNTDKGKDVFRKAEPCLYGHELEYEDVLRYQRPMRVTVPANPKRDEFMQDLMSLDYRSLCKKWKPRESFGLLFKKYVFGKNSQVVWWWSLKNRIKKAVE